MIVVGDAAAELPHVLARVPSCVDELVVVDRHSGDDTIAVASALVPEARVVMPRGADAAKALACGLRAVTGDIIVRLDVEGAGDPAEIPRYVARLLDGADYVKGSRLSPAVRHAVPLHRRLAGRALNALVNALAGTHFRDVGCGLCAFWADLLPVLELDGAPARVEVALNLRAAGAGLRIREVPAVELESPRAGEHARMRETLARAVRERAPRAPADGAPEYLELPSASARGAVLLPRPGIG